MPFYKLYIVTEDGHIYWRQDEKAPDRDAVLLAAEKLSDGQREVEIWEGASFIGRVLKNGTFSDQMRKRADDSNRG